jgi:23S rRNA pseudouridine2605 synthase
MADKAKPPKAKVTAPKTSPEGERIAKVLSRAGVASRREAERMIELGEVAVNGKVIDSPALNVTDKDVITVNGQPLAAAEPARLWLYYKPEGLVTSASDEKGRETVFDNLPPELPRVMSVGRLDLNSEGLLLLTNDGGLKRRLELPSTGWLRKYRVRVNGNPTDPDLEPLRRGITVEGERFQPMIVVLDRIQGANAWLTVGLREGRNREIRRAMAAIELTVNRLIRVSYGPFRLGDLQPGQVEEVKGRVLRDQLGQTDPEEDAPKPVKPTSRKVTGAKATTARTTSATGPRATAKPASGAKPRLKPGEGLKRLSDAWQEATTKRGAAPAKPAANSAGKPSARPASKAAAKPNRRTPTRNAPPRKPG